MSELTELIWYEKYRPKTLDELVLSEKLKNRINEFSDKEEIPHILLVGTAGIGKTSLAKILVEDILDCEYLNINASDEGGIDTIRYKVKSFASSASFDDKIKVVLLGEADGLSRNAQDSLKEIIEEYSETTRFIFTTNHLSKISEPIVSRCERIDITYTYSQYKDHCKEILKKENIEYEGTILDNILKISYPDFRKALTEIKTNSIGGVLVEPESAADKFVTAMWAFVTKKTPEETRKFYIEKSAHYNTYSELMVDMMHYSLDKFASKFSRKILPVMNKFLVQDKNHLDPELNFYCLILELYEMRTGGAG